MTSEMVVRPHAGPIEWTEAQQKLVRDTFANGASPAEFAVLLETAKVWSLDPFRKQLYFIQRWDSQKRCNVWAVQVSVDGLRAMAERTGLYEGQDEPEYEHDDQGGLKLCRVRVYRRDWPRPMVGVAYWSEYVQTNKDGVLTSFWRTKPHIMLAKCAEAIALRKAFPEQMAGAYAPEEMGEPEPVRARVTTGRTATSPSEGEPAEVTSSDSASATAPTLPESEALRRFRAELGPIATPAKAVELWIEHRATLAELTDEQRTSAWKSLCSKTDAVGKMKNSTVWLERAIAEEDARREREQAPEEPSPPARQAAPVPGTIEHQRARILAAATVTELQAVRESLSKEARAALGEDLSLRRVALCTTFGELTKLLPDVRAIKSAEIRERVERAVTTRQQEIEGRGPNGSSLPKATTSPTHPLDSPQARAFVAALTAVDSIESVVDAWLEHSAALESGGPEVIGACRLEALAAWTAYGGMNSVEALSAAIERKREQSSPTTQGTAAMSPSELREHLLTRSEPFEVAGAFWKRRADWTGETLAKCRAITVERLLAIGLGGDEKSASRWLDAQNPATRATRRASETERRSATTAANARADEATGARG